MLEGRVEGIGHRHVEVAGRIVLIQQEPVREHLVGRERQGEGERIVIGRSVVAAAALTIRVAEGPTGVGTGGSPIIPRLVSPTAMVLGTLPAWLRLKKPGRRSWIEDARAAAHHGLAIAGQVVGEAETRHELQVLVSCTVGRNAGVAGSEQHARGQGGELAGSLVRRVGAGEEFLQLSGVVVPGGEFFPAHAVVQLQPAVYLPAVLGIEAGEVVPIVHLLEVSLLKEFMKPIWKLANALGYW
jgi:hypothetical protein